MQRGRLGRWLQRQFHLEQRTATCGRGDPDAAVHQFGELLGDRQAQTGASEVASGASLPLAEALEDLLLHLGRYAGSGVLHRDQAATRTGAFKRAAHAPTGWSEFEGVGQQVLQDALGLVLVQRGAQCVGRGDNVAQVQLGRHCVELFGVLAHQGREVERCVVQVHALGVELGEIEQVVDVFEQGGGVSLDHTELAPQLVWQPTV